MARVTYKSSIREIASRMYNIVQGVHSRGLADMYTYAEQAYTDEQFGQEAALIDQLCIEVSQRFNKSLDVVENDIRKALAGLDLNLKLIQVSDEADEAEEAKQGPAERTA